MLPQCYSFFPRYFSFMSISPLIVVVLCPLMLLFPLPHVNVTLMLPQCYSFFPRYFSLMSTSALIVVVLCPLMSLFQLPHVQCYSNVTLMLPLCYLNVTLSSHAISLLCYSSTSLTFNVRPTAMLPLVSYLLPSSEPRQTSHRPEV